MMMNLFSSFDPQSSMFMSLNWTISPICMLLIPNKFWLNSNHTMKTFTLLQLTLKKEMKPIITNNINKGIIIIPMSLILMISIQNMSGLFPYLFTTPSHMSMTFNLALPIWLTLMMYGWIKKTNFMFAHLVPHSSPSLLIPFMVIIETTSNLIRPITLSVRLAANLTAGHLILTLIENASSTNTMTPLIALLFTQIMLFLLETAVAIIQAYVFSILVILYISEIN
uniref:ATP synthase subunit a n=1 Tax=Aposthonia japonica TaxID=911381 RepID=H7CD19_9NEOP|nr:ATP synthase F0 subunit 6 [Aposthonia japonica]